MNEHVIALYFKHFEASQNLIIQTCKDDNKKKNYNIRNLKSSLTSDKTNLYFGTPQNSRDFSNLSLQFIC